MGIPIGRKNEIISTVKFYINDWEVLFYKDLSEIFSLNLSKITSNANRNKNPEPSGL